jgi:hypothetical protein
MTIPRMDNVGVVVDDLEAATAFFVELGLDWRARRESRDVGRTASSGSTAVARLRAHGAQLVGELAQYEDKYRLCYLRGPEGIIVGLAEELPTAGAR